MGTGVEVNNTLQFPSSYKVEGDLPFEALQGSVAIKKSGYGVVLGPESFPPADGTIIDEDCQPIHECCCIVDGNHYLPNFQFGFDPASNTWLGKLTCNWHPYP